MRRRDTSRLYRNQKAPNLMKKTYFPPVMHKRQVALEPLLAASGESPKVINGNAGEIGDPQEW
jgi:hypothetical protein